MRGLPPLPLPLPDFKLPIKHQNPDDVLVPPPRLLLPSPLPLSLPWLFMLALASSLSFGMLASWGLSLWDVL